MSLGFGSHVGSRKDAWKPTALAVLPYLNRGMQSLVRGGGFHVLRRWNELQRGDQFDAFLGSSSIGTMMPEGNSRGLVVISFRIAPPLRIAIWAFAMVISPATAVS